MREKHCYKIPLKHIKQKHFDFINNFDENSKKILNHLIKSPPIGVLKIEYIITNSYHVTQIILGPSF